MVTKESLSESNTHYAQGGIAVATEGDEDITLHLADTIKAGDGLVYRPAAEALVAEGPVRVAELIEWGARFDTEHGELLRTREGRPPARAHFFTSGGDATGAEISRSLVEHARAASKSASALPSGPWSQTWLRKRARSPAPILLLPAQVTEPRRADSSALPLALFSLLLVEQARSTPTPPIPQ